MILISVVAILMDGTFRFIYECSSLINTKKMIFKYKVMYKIK